MALLATAACADLPVIPGGSCGNRVVDVGEECDDPSSEACHAPDTEYQCRVNCGIVACAEGATCGLDAVCRVPSARMSPVAVDVDIEFVSEYSFWPEREPLVGEFNGDGRADALVFGHRALSLSFDSERRPSVSDLSLDVIRAVVTRLNGDELDDVVFFGDDVDVLEGTPSGLRSVPQLRPPPPSDAQRLLSIRAGADGFATPLLLADRSLFELPVFSEDAFVPLAELPVSAGEVAGSIPSFRSPGDTSCPAFAIAAEGGDSVHVYEICWPETKQLQTVALPAPLRVGKTGVHAGDVDGDGLLDLVVGAQPAPDADAAQEELTHVAYGLGDGRYQSQRRAVAGVIADNAASADPVSSVKGTLLQVGDLDGDLFLDMITESPEIWFGPGRPGGCEDAICNYSPYGRPWETAAVADFTGDGIFDIVALPVGQRSLTFLLAVGDGRFNSHSMGVGSSSARDEPASASVAVGDFDGDLIADFAFTTLGGTGRAPARRAAVLFGTASAVPSDIQSTEIVGDFDELVAIETKRFDRQRGSDLLFRATTDDGSGLGMLQVARAGSGLQALASSSIGRGVEPSRVLTSPLTYPTPSLVDEVRSAYLIGLAPGSFSGDAKREEAIGIGNMEAYADDSDSDSEPTLWLTFAENRQSGLAFLDPGDALLEAPSALVESLRHSWDETPLYPIARALDIDADGSDELIVVDWHVVANEIPYWVIKRVGGAWAIVENRIEVPGLGDLELLDTQKSGRRTTDVDRDGRPDLVLQGWRETGTAIIVVRNEGSGALAAGAVFVIDSDVNSGVSDLWKYAASPTAFVNVDGDAALELVAASGDGLRFYDADLLSGTLDELSNMRAESGPVSGLTVGDFDGDGLDDVAALGQTSAVYFSEAVAP